MPPSFIQSLIHLNFFGVFLSLALGYILFQYPLELYIISPWLLILAAVLLSIGFHSIFRRRPKCAASPHRHDDNYRTIEDVDDNNPYIKVSFGSASKYLHGDCLKSGQFYCSFGALELYFDQVTPDPAGAEIFLDCQLRFDHAFCPTNLARIVDKLHSSLGSVKDEASRAVPGDRRPGSHAYRRRFAGQR